MNQDNKIKILSELGERFSIYRDERSGQKLIVYSKELKELVRATVELGISIAKVAEACKVSNASVRDWIKGSGRPQPVVKKLELDEQLNVSFGYAKLHINNRFVIEIPVSALMRELDLLASYK